jgi:hypothetical protein
MDNRMPRKFSLTKDEFKGYASCLKYPANVTFSLFRPDEGNPTLTLDEFCGALAGHDKDLAAKVHAWHTAARAMLDHIEARSEGFTPDPLAVNAGGHTF